jgi:hypothetical protein
MTKEDDLQAVIELIYEAVLDDTLWPKALTRLADAIGTAQIGLLSLLSLDRRARTYDSIAPHTDPVMDAIFKKYWAFHNPLWPRTIAWPAGEVFLLDSLIPRKDFVATPFFNEWMRPAPVRDCVDGCQFAGRERDFDNDLRCQCARER